MNDPAVSPAENRLGRYTHLELSAMRGRRGRKPPEFYELFPELRKEAAAPGAAATTESSVKPEPKRSSKGMRKADELAERIRAAPAAVRQIILAMLAYAEDAASPLPATSDAAPASPSMTPDAAATSVQTALISPDPVYADPEIDLRDHLEVHGDEQLEIDREPEVGQAV